MTLWLEDILATIPRLYEERITTDSMLIGAVTAAGTIVKCALCGKGAIAWGRDRHKTFYAHIIDRLGKTFTRRTWCEVRSQPFTESKR